MSWVECNLPFDESISTSQSIYKLLTHDYTHLIAPSKFAPPVQMYTDDSQHMRFVQHPTTTTTGLASETLLSETLSQYL